MHAGSCGVKYIRYITDKSVCTGLGYCRWVLLFIRSYIFNGVLYIYMYSNTYSNIYIKVCTYIHMNAKIQTFYVMNSKAV